ncbi:MAG: aspartate aminotransferase family protein [Oligoflexia bacterium]|nr:aspartate aminotransferase family protein [Oligoflexia bacterium]
MAGIVVDHALGSTITDIDGNRFLDIIGGIGVGGIGHSHPQYIKALSEQLNKAVIGSFTSEVRVKLLELINEHKAHPDLNRVQFYSSGAEAVESALRLAKNYTGKWEFVSCWGGFHGKTSGALSLMGSDFKDSYGPFAPGAHLIPYANCFRCPFNLQDKGYPEGCGLYCVEYARKQLKMQKSKGIAAFIIEPMQGTAGNVIPPNEYMKAIADLASEFEALLIVDEMISGFGRTGKYYGHMHSQIRPDIITVGKQFAGGFPLSAIISSKEITSAKPWSNPSGSSSSYGGNPLAMAASLAALQIIDQDNLVENSRLMGEYFLSKIKDYPTRFPSFIGEVHGKGLFMGIEFVDSSNNSKKTLRSPQLPLPPLAKDKCKIIFDEFLKRGLLTMSYTSSFRIQPAMTIDKETIDNIVNIMDEVFLKFHSHNIP